MYSQYTDYNSIYGIKMMFVNIKKKHEINFISCVKNHADIVTVKMCIICIFRIMSVLLALLQKLKMKLHTFFKRIYYRAYNTYK